MEPLVLARTPLAGCSTARILANRRNAQLSRGPVTREGKLTSRRNALKHGILARALPAREAAGNEGKLFDALLAGLCEDLQPRGQIELTLVESLAADLFRLRRIQEVETAVLSDCPPAPEPDGPSAEVLRFQAQVLSRLAQELARDGVLSLPEEEARWVADLLNRRLVVYRGLGRLEGLTSRALGFQDEPQLLELLTGRTALPSRARSPWTRLLDRVCDDLAKMLAERLRADASHDQRVESRALALAKKLPSLESLTKYDSHRRLWVARTLRTLRELRRDAAAVGEAPFACEA